MKTLRAVSFDDFVEWYLRRENTKGNIRSVPETRFERRILMEATQHGKLWPGCASWPWSLVEVAPSELSNLLILADDWTRDELLVRKGVVRTLGNTVTHALDSGYFTDLTDRRTRHHGYYHTFEHTSPSTSEIGRLVLRTLHENERSEVDAGHASGICYYLHDGFGRLLPYLTLLQQKQVEPVVIEAFLAGK